LTTNNQAQTARILAGYSRHRDSLIPVLQEVQQQYGYLPSEAMQQIADYLHLSNSTVYAVSTFYSQFRFTPGGRSTVKICCGTACHVQGGARILDDTERRLGIKPGETTTASTPWRRWPASAPAPWRRWYWWTTVSTAV